MSRARLAPVLPVSLALLAASCSSTHHSATALPSGSASPKASASPGVCTPGIIDHGAYRTQDFCGPAHVEFTAAGKHYQVKGGVCLVGVHFISVTIGSRVLGPERARPTGAATHTAAASAVPTGTASPTARPTQAPIPNLPYSLYALLVGRTPGGTDPVADGAGTYPAGSMIVTVSGQPLPIAQTPVTTVKLAADRRSGTFSGTLLLGGTIAGTFDCGPAA